MSLQILILALVTLQRISELWLARRNTRALIAAGAREYGAAHYPLIVGLHAAWLAGLWILAWDRPISLPWLAAFIVLQALRVWVIVSLGRRWTTRIIVPPDEEPIRRGPYRWVSHPNYMVVTGEIAALPLVFGLAGFAAVFSLLNAAVLVLRIRTEERALRVGASVLPTRECW